MVCCVIVAMMFALPFVLVRGLYGLFTGGNCSMAWRPVSQSASDVGAIANEIPAADRIFQYRASEANGLNKGLATGRGFTIVDRAKSFRYAGRGAVRLLRYEHSAWIQLSIASVAIVLAIVLNISMADWRWIIVACGLVLSLEGLNTAVERTCDRISVAYCGQIKVAKDVAAGAVLLGSIAAALIGVLTFIPYLTDSSAAIADVSRSSNTTGLAPGSGSAGSDYSRFAIFHCVNPLQATPALSGNIDGINRVKAGA